MDQFRIHGGARLTGQVEISGAKNATLPLMAAALLGEEPSVIEGAPDLTDVRTMAQVLRHLGAGVEMSGGRILIDSRSLDGHEAPYELVKKMRAAYYVLGPMVARFGQARVSLPGGCVIGPRPIDLHLAGLAALGADVSVHHGYIVAEADRLKGVEINLMGPRGTSVGATINVMMAATRAEGVTMIENAAREPEVVEVARFLEAMGVEMEGVGTARLVVQGRRELGGATHQVIPDRIEAGTLAVAGAVTEGRVRLTRCRPDHLEASLRVLREVGVDITVGSDWVEVNGSARRQAFRATVAPYPGFPTDMQAQFITLATVTPGISVITETIFENRFMHVPELRRLGAKIEIEENTAVVTGVERLTGAAVMASDLRASAALVLAGLVGEGVTTVSRIYHLDRGYERFGEKLRGLGAEIERVRG